jgi:hypothetical protein
MANNDNFLTRGFTGRGKRLLAESIQREFGPEAVLRLSNLEQPVHDFLASLQQEKPFNACQLADWEELFLLCQEQA